VSREKYQILRSAGYAYTKSWGAFPEHADSPGFKGEAKIKGAGRLDDNDVFNPSKREPEKSIPIETYGQLLK
jgi:hypothetical protein